MLMDEDASEADLEAYFRWVSTMDMGLTEGPELIERNKRAARLLYALRPEFQMH